MKAAISVKSPFSHNALFGFMKAPLLGLAFSKRDASSSELQLCSAFAPTTMAERRPDLPERLAETNRLAEIPGKFADRPKRSHGRVLANPEWSPIERRCVLQAAEFSAPWGLSTPTTKVLAATTGVGTEHLVLYHLVIEGGAIIELIDGQRTELSPGDIVIFPHGDPHHMSSGTGQSCRFGPMGSAPRLRLGTCLPYAPGAAASISRFVCGYMSCDPHLGRPILHGLPPVFKVNIRTDPSGRWLENSILHLVEEAASGRIGSEAMLAKLSEALFVDTLRRFVASLPEQQTGWLTGVRDPIVGKSLGLLHSRIAHPWTIAGLADEVGISRSALVQRFIRYLSEPPMTYLTRCRLQLAARSLERTARRLRSTVSESWQGKANGLARLVREDCLNKALFQTESGPGTSTPPSIRARSDKATL